MHSTARSGSATTCSSISYALKKSNPKHSSADPSTNINTTEHSLTPKRVTSRSPPPHFLFGLILFLEMHELETEKLAIKIKDEDSVAEYYHLRAQLHKLKQNFRDFINQPTYSVPYLQPGRLVKVFSPSLSSSFSCISPSFFFCTYSAHRLLKEIKSGVGVWWSTFRKRTQRYKPSLVIHLLRSALSSSSFHSILFFFFPFFLFILY